MRVRIGILRRARTLHLRFTDASALWLTRSGAGLAAPATTDSAAHRFASAHAQKSGWEMLTGRANWPVPQPCEVGDWLAAPAPILPALRDQILRDASFERLVGSSLNVDRTLACQSAFKTDPA